MYSSHIRLMRVGRARADCCIRARHGRVFLCIFGMFDLYSKYIFLAFSRFY